MLGWFGLTAAGAWQLLLEAAYLGFGALFPNVNM